jgi:uncharacterized SAM-binding protein YcdF (DUF218 family)
VLLSPNGPRRAFMIPVYRLWSRSDATCHRGRHRLAVNHLSGLVGLRSPAGAHIMASVSVDDWARTLWDYHHVGQALEQADTIIALGSHDTRVAERGAELFQGGWAPLLLFSGHLGGLTSGMWTRSEAEIFADVAAGMGVPRERMLVEARSTNTGENVDFSRRLLADKGLLPRRAIAVQKPYMERRTLATFRQRWPELEVRVTSPQIAFDAYPTGAIRKDDVIHIMVGDLQRLIVYGQRGWSAPQDVPPEVLEAYEGLIAAGYTRRLIAHST